MSNTSFGVKLKELQGQQHHTQAELAELAGVSAGYISQLENGRKPADNVLSKLSKALDVDENVLFITVGKIKMEFPESLGGNRSDAPQLLSNLSDQEWRELTLYLTCMKIRASIASK